MLFFSRILPPPRSTLFPYTTLFRSKNREILRLKRTTPEIKWLQEFAAEFVAYEGKIYTEFVPSVHVKRIPYNPKDRKSTRLNSSHLVISYAVFCLKKKKNKQMHILR